MQDIIMLVLNHLLELLMSLIAIGVIYLLDQYNLKKKVEEAIMYAQQIGLEKPGNERMQIALDYLSNRLVMKFGLNEEKLKLLIEANLRKLKLEFQDRW